MLCCGWVSSISEVQQRAFRLSVAVLIACVIGFGLILPDAGVRIQHAKEFSNGLKWSAITCIVVSAPVIGRVAQTGTERILGTIVGGFLGFGVFSVGSYFWTPVSDGVILSIAAAIVAFTSVTIGAAFGLENSTKLYALTFMLVTFGSDSLASRQGSLMLAVTRMSGICFGVLLSEITSVLIFPKSATAEALLHLRKSLKNLIELNAMAWQHGPLFRPGWEFMIPHSSGTEQKGDFLVSGGHLHTGEDWLADAEKRESHFEEECERVLMQTYSFLNKVQDFLPQAKSEVYIGHLRGQLCFLPGIPWLSIGRRVLPEADVQELVTCIRRVARLLWTVHLSFQQGFDLNMLEMLKQQFPAQLMPELAQQTQDCLQDMHDAFPNAPVLPKAHLHGVLAAVESLLRISDYQRRRILHYMKRTRCQERSRRGSSPRSVPAPDHLERKLAESASRKQSGVTNLEQLVMGPAASGRIPPRGLDHRDYAFGRSKSKRFEGSPALASVDSPDPPRKARMSFGRKKAENVQDGENLGAPLLRRAGSEASSNADLQEEEAAPEQRATTNGGARSEKAVSPFAALALASTSNEAYDGSPNEVFRNLPEGLSIDVGSPAAGLPNNSYTVDMESGEEEFTTVHVHLQRIGSEDLIVFPETAEGYVDKVRWYSFQFLMEQLIEEIEIMHTTIGRLLPKLPQPCLAL